MRSLRITVVFLILALGCVENLVANQPKCIRLLLGGKNTELSARYTLDFRHSKHVYGEGFFDLLSERRDPESLLKSVSWKRFLEMDYWYGSKLIEEIDKVEVDEDARIRPIPDTPLNGAFSFVVFGDSGIGVAVVYGIDGEDPDRKTINTVVNSVDIVCEVANGNRLVWQTIGALDIRSKSELLRELQFVAEHMERKRRAFSGDAIWIDWNGRNQK